MKKIVLIQISFVIVLAVFIFCICYKKEPADISLSVIDKGLAKSVSEMEVVKAGEMKLVKYTGLNPADYDEVLYYLPSNTMAVDEILIVKLKSDSQSESVKSAINARLESQKKAFDGYGVDQYDILKNAKIYQDGKYICFVSGKGASDILGQIRTILKES